MIIRAEFLNSNSINKVFRNSMGGGDFFWEGWALLSYIRSDRHSHIIIAKFYNLDYQIRRTLSHCAIWMKH